MRVTDAGFILCPHCGGRTKTKITPGRTVMKNFPLFCPWCKRETLINYNPGQSQ